VSELEDTFAAAWRMSGQGRLVTEFQFAPTRKFRFDFANEASKVAVEMEGGIFGKGGKKCATCGQVSAGRHSRPIGFHNDCEKLNFAAADSWVIFRFTAKHMKEQPIQCVEMVAKAIKDRAPRTESK
jgi:very-short-patch-repair endonuclease